MVAMAEELGVEMAIRSLEHLLQYGEQNIRRAVPLALGLLCISNPKVRSFGFVVSLWINSLMLHQVFSLSKEFVCLHGFKVFTETVLYLLLDH